MKRKKGIKRVNTNHNLLKMLLDIRKKNNWTIGQLAKEFGTSRALMNGYISGLWPIPAPDLIAGILYKRETYPDLFSCMSDYVIKKSKGNGNGHTNS